MTVFEKAAIIGYYRQGMEWSMIACIMGISESYASQIVQEYLKNVPRGTKNKRPQE